jgi:hypothetical protein
MSFIFCFVVKFHVLHSKSPTSATPDSFISPTSQSGRPDKVTIMVTADSDNYATVDITGAKNAAFIRERMFTKVRDSYLLYQCSTHPLL